MITNFCGVLNICDLIVYNIIINVTINNIIKSNVIIIIINFIIYTEFSKRFA